MAQPFRMTDQPRNRQKPNDHKTREQARLAEALRENLKRRKARAKGRAAIGCTGEGAKPHDSAGIGDDKHGE